MRNYFDLGNYHRQISTSVAEATPWFNRGLIWCYGFNQEESVRCFEKVLELDPGCAMAYWGIAYAEGPFYNKPWGWYGENERVQTIARCHEFARKANHKLQFRHHEGENCCAEVSALSRLMVSDLDG